MTVAVSSTIEKRSGKRRFPAAQNLVSFRLTGINRHLCHAALAAVGLDHFEGSQPGSELYHAAD